MYKITPLTELQSRISRLQQLMADAKVPVALITQRIDLFYFSGTAQDGYLLVPFSGPPHLLIRKNLSRARRESNLESVEPLSGWDHLQSVILKAFPPTAGGRENGLEKSLGLELDVLPTNLYLRLGRLLPGINLVDISPAIKRVRAVKSPYEIELIRKAADLSEQMFSYARAILSEGITELQLASRLEAFVRSRGHQGAVRMRNFNQELFYGHVLSGKSGAVPTFFDGPTGGSGINPSYPLGAGYKPVVSGEPVLIDFVTVLEGYMVDQTRLFWLGNLPENLHRAYRLAQEITRSLIPLGAAGAGSRELYLHACMLSDNAGLGDYFMGHESKANFIGHGVGLELDELPVITGAVDFTLDEGMVFALEPKFVFPDQGAVGIEDTFVVRPHGLEQLTRG